MSRFSLFCPADAWSVYFSAADSRSLKKGNVFMCVYVKASNRNGFVVTQLSLLLFELKEHFSPNLESQPLFAVVFYQDIKINIPRYLDKFQKHFGEETKRLKLSPEKDHSNVRDPAAQITLCQSLMGSQWKQGVHTKLISHTVGCRQKEDGGILFLYKSLLASACYLCHRIWANSAGWGWAVEFLPKSCQWFYGQVVLSRANHTYRLFFTRSSYSGGN